MNTLVLIIIGLAMFLFITIPVIFHQITYKSYRDEAQQRDERKED
jgi:multisubunit Na+/H+ antiporter MnhG subunit